MPYPSQRQASIALRFELGLNLDAATKTRSGAGSILGETSDPTAKKSLYRNYGRKAPPSRSGNMHPSQLPRSPALPHQGSGVMDQENPATKPARYI
jgi:hypothetical protein